MRALCVLMKTNSKSWQLSVSIVAIWNPFRGTNSYLSLADIVANVCPATGSTAQRPVGKNTAKLSRALLEITW